MPDEPYEGVEDRAEDIANVGAFLMFMQAEQPKALWGGRRIDEVVRSFSRLVGIPPTVLRSIMIAGEMPPKGSFDGEQDGDDGEPDGDV